MASVEAFRYGTLVAQMDELNIMEKPRAYVFAVCGSAQHIARFQQSASILSRRTTLPIWVVTDAQRNEVPLQHDLVVDVPVPSSLDHRQASIYLKTTLHRNLPKNTLYCYLDTDVIALSAYCNLVFDAFLAPISFAPDFVSIDAFSRFAINCGCEEQLKHAIASRNHASNLYAATLAKEYSSACHEIDVLTANNNRTWIHRIASWIKYNLSNGRYFVLNDAYKQDKSSGRWTDNDGVSLHDKYDRGNFLAQETGLRWDVIHQDLVLNGAPLSSYTCQHLQDAIRQKFGMDAIPNNWQHWNGGVFMFDENATPFMEFWHNATLSILEDDAWKVRDQGTLAATVWHFGLQHHATLESRFNRIIDLAAQNAMVMDDATLVVDGKKEYPAFLHALGLNAHGLHGINALMDK